MDVPLKWPYFGISPFTLEPLCGIYRCFDPDVKQQKRTTRTNIARRLKNTTFDSVICRQLTRYQPTLRCAGEGIAPRESFFFVVVFQADAAARSLGWRINTYYLWQRRSDGEEYSCCPRMPPWDCYLCSTYIRHRCAHTHLSALNAT